MIVSSCYTWSNPSTNAEYFYFICFCTCVTRRLWLRGLALPKFDRNLSLDLFWPSTTPSFWPKVARPEILRLVEAATEETYLTFEIIFPCPKLFLMCSCVKYTLLSPSKIFVTADCKYIRQIQALCKLTAEFFWNIIGVFSYSPVMLAPSSVL